MPGSGLLVPESFADGAALLEATRERGLEGVVAKRRSSPYRAGVRSDDWVKVPHRTTRSYVVGGWKSRTDSPGRLASLLVCVLTAGILMVTLLRLPPHLPPLPLLRRRKKRKKLPIEVRPRWTR